MKDTTNRMVMGQIEKDLDKEIKQEEVIESKEEAVLEDANNLPPIDLDLENFFFTGNIEYTFSLGKKFTFTLRLPASDEVADLHKNLYSRVKDEKETMTDAEFDIRRINGIIALSLIKYGSTDLSDKSKEERLAFVNKLPGVVVQTLSRCYVRLENSAAEVLINNSDTLKN